MKRVPIVEVKCLLAAEGRLLSLESPEAEKGVSHGGDPKHREES